MGEPARGHARAPRPESNRGGGTTRGTETSKYPEEEKSTEIARVAASESARAQTRARVSGRRCRPGVVGASSQALPAWAGSQRSWVAERHGRAGRSG